MKRIMLFFISLNFICGTISAQEPKDWKLKKTEALHYAGLQTEAHDLKFSNEFLKKKGQFMEVMGGLGIFAPSSRIAQNLSGGLLFHKGNKQHFLSVGMHLTYSVAIAQEMRHLLNNETYTKTPLIGYQYQNNKMNFKFLIEPTSVSIETTFSKLPAGTIGFGCNF